MSALRRFPLDAPVGGAREVWSVALAQAPNTASRALTLNAHRSKPSLHQAHVRLRVYALNSLERAALPAATPLFSAAVFRHLAFQRAALSAPYAALPAHYLHQRSAQPFTAASLLINAYQPQGVLSEAALVFPFCAALGAPRAGLSGLAPLTGGRGHLQIDSCQQATLYDGAELTGARGASSLMTAEDLGLTLATSTAELAGHLASGAAQGQVLNLLAAARPSMGLGAPAGAWRHFGD